MSYVVSSGMTFTDHAIMSASIHSAGKSIERSVHASMMQLATAQAGAMQRLGERIDDRLIQIDETLLQQQTQMSVIGEALFGIGRKITEIEQTLERMETRIDRIEHNVANPQEARAFESFRLAVDLHKRGFDHDALGHINAAIHGNGGPGFGHIPEFHALAGEIQLGAAAGKTPEVADAAGAHRSFLAALMYGEDKSPAKVKAGLHHQAGMAAYASHDFTAARDSFRKAIDLLDSERDAQLRALSLYHLARTCLFLNDAAGFRAAMMAALEISMDFMVTAASDGDMIAHERIVMPVLQEFHDREHPKLVEGIQALEHVLSETTDQNMRKSLRILCREDGKDRPFWIEGMVFYERNQRIYEDAITVTSLRDPGATSGLIDLRNRLHRFLAPHAAAYASDHHKERGFRYCGDKVERRVATILARWGALAKNVDMMELCLSDNDLPRYYVNHFGWGHERAPEPLQANEKKTLLGRPSKAQRTWDKANDEITARNAERDEMRRRAIARIKREVAPQFPVIRKRCKRSVEIAQLAAQTLKAHSPTYEGYTIKTALR